MVKFGRLLTAMVTPFNENLQVNYQAAQDLAVRLIESGSNGVVVAGTTGESPTLTKKEKVALFEAVVEAVGGRGTVIAGTGSYDTAESMELTREAERTGVDGVMLVAPYYNKPSQEGLYRHFMTIANATSLPVIIYNIPGRTGVNLTVDTMARLSQAHNIVAAKEASGNLSQISELYEKAPRDFAIYSGDDALTLPVLSVGGVGVISVASHIVGRKMQEMITAFCRGDLAIAIQINIEISPLIRALFVTTNPTMVKAACNLLGFKAGGMRLPMVEASPAEIKIMQDALRSLGLVECLS
jgi:4-hydroxy-tetrahydrodipicolinate synthase